MRQETTETAADAKKGEWAVVLSDSVRPWVKGRLIQRLAHAFSLPREEAQAILNHLPVILLDQISEAAALKTRDYFKSSGADIFLTKDPDVLRRCYRMVWSQSVELPFLIGSVSSAAGRVVPSTSAPEVPAATGPSQALPEVPEETPAKADVTASDSAPNEPSGEKNILTERYERLQNEYGHLKEKYFRMRENLERDLKEAVSTAEGIRTQEQEKKESLRNLETENRSLKQALEKATNDLNRLKNELTQERDRFRQSLTEAAVKLDQWKVRVQQAAEMLKTVEEFRDHLEKSMRAQSRGWEEFLKQIPEEQRSPKGRDIA